MPKALFDQPSADAQLVQVLKLLNDAMAGARNAKTAEDIANIVFNLTRVINQLKDMMK
jgi:hypothetical protein